MKKQLILAAVFSIVLFGFGFINSAQALNDPIPGIDIVVCRGCSSITASDLGIDNVGTLPTSNFYFFKQWSRGLQRFFTLDSVAKAELELNITNQIAAEVIEVEKTKFDESDAFKKALENYTDAQERLNTKLAKLTETSENPNVEKLLKEVDEKTAKHVDLLEQVSARVTFTLAGMCEAFCHQYEDLQSVVDNALNNTLKTFTVTPVNDAPSLKQKAEEQIKRSGVAISEANSALMQVTTTRGINVNPGDVDVRGSGKIVETIDEQSSIFDRWGNLIAKAKSNLDNAKKAFAEGKYGEAYGQARSAEAMVAVLATGQNFPDARINTTTPTPSPALKLSPKPSTSPTAKPTPEKTETPGSAGSPVR